MPDQWFYEVMGEEVGPLTSAELKRKADSGEITPETRIRAGEAGKWHDASRVKGLFPEQPIAEPSESSGQSEPVASKPESTTYSLHGVADSPGEGSASPDDSPEEEAERSDFEFFEFVGFEQAVSHPLFAEVEKYGRKHQLSLTQVVRKALAELVGKPELAERKPHRSESDRSESE